MHKTQAFKTSDGKLFEDEAGAAVHETKIKISEWANRKGIAEDGALTCEKFAEAMVDDAEELAHLFLSLVRALPKTGEGSFIGGFINLPDEQNAAWRANAVNSQRLAG